METGAIEKTDQPWPFAADSMPHHGTMGAGQYAACEGTVSAGYPASGLRRRGLSLQKLLGEGDDGVLTRDTQSECRAFDALLDRYIPVSVCPLIRVADQDRQ